MKIDLDTNRIRECGQDIIRLTNELNELIHGLFDRICNMPEVAQEWVGVSANEYARIAKIDKIQYLTLKDELCQEGKFLVEQADVIEQELQQLRLK